MSNSTYSLVMKSLLHRDQEGPDCNHSWNNCTTIGMLGYLSGNTQPNILMTVHQFAHFNMNPPRSYKGTVKHVGWYLCGTSNKCLTLTPNKSCGIECSVDADFASIWQLEDSQYPLSVMSPTGYIILFAGCPVIWVSKLQTVCQESSTESKYITLNQSLCDVIRVMELLKELIVHMSIKQVSPVINCMFFQDNNGSQSYLIYLICDQVLVKSQLNIISFVPMLNLANLR